MNQGRKLLAALPRVNVVRLAGMGFPLLIGLGLVLAFHYEVGVKRLAPPLDFAATLCLAMVLPVAYALLVRAFEGRWPLELAPRPGARRFVGGFAIGVGLFSAVYAVFTVMGVASWQGFNNAHSVAPILLLSLVAGVGEELLFRGVLFRVLEESFGTLAALAVSAALFGAMHAGNPGATVESSIAIAVEAGVMLAAAYAWSRNLWLPIGIHVAWNFTEGGVYGAAVSGEKVEGLLRVVLSPTASPLVTGGAFGPEASVVAVAICLGLGAVFIGAAVRAGRWRGASFRMVLDRVRPSPRTPG